MSDDILKNLGPLAALAGVWEGDEGLDTAPSASRDKMETPYRERACFEAFGPVDNHEQRMWGLRYNMTAWRLNEDDPFHEELGYWLWDPSAKQVLRCFMVPRAVTILAGGTVEPNAKSFSLAADVGSETYGICSNRFLDEKFKTVRYELEMAVQDDGRLSYTEDTQLKIQGQDGIFHHTDTNTMKKVG